jgi:hypothetical protein
MNRNLIVVLIFFLLGVLAAAVSANENAHTKGERLGSSHSEVQLRPYFLNLASCPIFFKGRAGGYAEIQSSDPTAGYVGLPEFGERGNLSINFVCVLQAAKDYCPSRALNQLGDDSSTRKQMNTRHYSAINALYAGEAFARNLTAVPRPRVRILTFCIGDDRRAIYGSSQIGTEHQHVASKVVDLLGTLRFADVPTRSP